MDDAEIAPLPFFSSNLFSGNNDDNDHDDVCEKITGNDLTAFCIFQRHRTWLYIFHCQWTASRPDMLWHTMYDMLGIVLDSRWATLKACILGLQGRWELETSRSKRPQSLSSLFKCLSNMGKKSVKSKSRLFPFPIPRQKFYARALPQRSQWPLSVIRDVTAMATPIWPG